MTPAQETEQDFASDLSSEAARAAKEEAAGTPVAEPMAAKEERRPGPDLKHIRTGAIIIAILGLLALLHFAASVFITLFSAMLLAFALEPLVHLLCVRTRLRRPHASGIVVFLFVAMLYGLFYVTYLRAESFIAEIPAIAEKIRSAPMVESLAIRAEELNRVFAEAGRRIVPPPEASARPKTPPPVVVRDEADSFTGALLQGLGSLSGVVFALGFIPFLVYFILADREPLTRRTRELFPERAPRDGGGDPPRHRADDAEVPPRERRDRPHPLHGDRSGLPARGASVPRRSRDPERDAQHRPVPRPAARAASRASSSASSPSSRGAPFWSWSPR